MQAVFADWPEAVAASVEIAERCNVKITLDSHEHREISRSSICRMAVTGRSISCASARRDWFSGMARSAPRNDASLRERMDSEIVVMREKGFVSYFLIVRDFIAWARDHGIPVGPGRGSAAGSLVAYLLGITDICPLRFSLVFERFLNPERVSPPDIDIDFCQDRRAEVIQYVREKYGERSVSHIITFGKMLARSAVRDVGRVLGWGYGETDALAKMIPQQPGKNITLADGAIDGARNSTRWWRPTRRWANSGSSPVISKG